MVVVGYLIDVINFMLLLGDIDDYVCDIIVVVVYLMYMYGCVFVLFCYSMGGFVV